MVTLSIEQREELKKVGDAPIRIEDPETHATYVLLRAEVYEGLRPPPAPEYEDLSSLEIAEGICRAKEAFLRDLPVLLERKRLHGRWALYHLEKQIGIWRNPQRMLRKIVKLRLPKDKYYYGLVGYRSPEPEEIEQSFLEVDEIEQSS